MVFGANTFIFGGNIVISSNLKKSAYHVNYRINNEKTSMDIPEEQWLQLSFYAGTPLRDEAGYQFM